MSETPSEAPMSLEDKGQARSRGMKSAILSTVPTKGANFLVQIFLLPIYATAIGTERFGAYTNIIALLGFIGMANLAMGPAMTLLLARNVDGESGEDRSTVASSYLIFVISAALELIVVFIILAIKPPQEWIDPKFASVMSEAVICFWIVLVINVLQRFAALVEFIRLGYQQQAVNNLATGIATVFVIIGLFVGRYLFPSLWMLPLIVFGPIVLAAIVNGIFLVRQKPYLAPSIKSVTKPKLLEILRINSSSAVMFVGDYLTLPAFVLIFTPLNPVQAVSAVGILTNFHRLAIGVMGSVTTPAYPALAQAVAAGDSGWANRAFGKIRLFAIGFGVIYFALIATIGPALIEKLYSAEFKPQFTHVLGYGLFSALTAVEHAYYWYLVAFQREWLSAALMVSRGVACVIACWIISKTLPGSYIPFGLAIGVLATTLWAMPFAASRLKRNLSHQTPEQEPS